MKQENHEIIREYVMKQIEWAIKSNNPHYKTTKLAESCRKLERELIERGLLTEEDVKKINS